MPKAAKKKKALYRKAVPEADTHLADEAAAAALALKEDLFAVDVTGSLKGLPKSVRKAIAKDPHGTGTNKRVLGHVERNQVVKATKMKRSARVEAKVAEDAKAVEVFDMWAPAEKKTARAFPNVRRMADEHVVGRGVSGFRGLTKSPAVMPPASGHSVNAAPEDREALVSKAVSVELEKEREIQRRNAANRPMTALLQEHFAPEELKAMDEPAKLAAYLRIARGGEADDADCDGPVEAKPTKEKTRAQLNKAARRKAMEALETGESRQKKLDKSIGEVGRFTKEMKSAAAQQKAERDYAKQLKSQELAEVAKGLRTKTKRTGKHQFEEPALEVPEEEGRKTLREAPKLSAVETTVQSFYRRNLLEAPPKNSAAHARYVQKRVRKAQVKRQYVAKEMKDPNWLI